MRTTADEMLARAVLVCIFLPAWAMILDVIYNVSIVAVVRGTKSGKTGIHYLAVLMTHILSGTSGGKLLL
jgi:hypothetical protein